MKQEKLDKIFEKECRRVNKKDDCKIIIPFSKSQKMTFKQAAKYAAKHTYRELIETGFLYDLDSGHPITPIIAGGPYSVEMKPLKEGVRKGKIKISRIGDFHTHPENVGSGFSVGDIAASMNHPLNIVELSMAAPDEKKMVVMKSPRVLPKKEQEKMWEEMESIDKDLTKANALRNKYYLRKNEKDVRESNLLILKVRDREIKLSNQLGAKEFKFEVKNK